MSNNPFATTDRAEVRFREFSGNIALQYVPTGSPLIEALRSAAVIVLPYSEPAEIPGRFPSASDRLFQRLGRDLAPQRVEIATTDDDYRELVLHGGELVLATIWVGQHVLAPTVIDVIANLIAERIRSPFGDRPQRVKSKLLVAQPGGVLEFEFEGPAETYATTMRELLRSGLPSRDEGG